MLKTRILSAKIKFFSKDESSGLSTYTLKCEEQPGEAELAEVGIFCSGCMCSYDCCGHLQRDYPSVVRHIKRKEWYVSQHWYFNV